jgi:hypothetical protein
VKPRAVRGVATVLAALLALTSVPALAANAPIDGIAIGTTVTALAVAAGFPTAVASEDSGNRFVFPDGTTAYADDDGRVLAIAVTSGTARVAIDGTPYAFEIGRYTVGQAERDLAADAEYATPALHSYRLEPRRDLVLGFDAAQRLQRVTYGEPGQLARLGLLPGDAAAKAVLYRPPHPLRPGFAAIGDGPLTAVYRISVDRSGAVAEVALAIPPAPAVPPGTTAEVAGPIAAGLKGERYAPALLDGKPIAGTIFVRVRFGPPHVDAAAKP